MKKNILVIINPVSGDGSAKNWSWDIIDILSSGFEYVTVYVSRGVGDIKRAVEENAGKYGHIVCMGGDGTLNYNMKSYPAATRNRIKAKSGSMNGIRCYSGYILPSSPDGETVIFSIMTNNCTSPTWKVRPLLDKIMGTLATCN